MGSFVWDIINDLSAERERSGEKAREGRWTCSIIPALPSTIMPSFLLLLPSSEGGREGRDICPHSISCYSMAVCCKLASLSLSYGGRARGEGRLHLIMSKAPPLCGGRKAILLLWLPSIRKHFWQICWGWRSRPKRISKSKIYLLVN